MNGGCSTTGTDPAMPDSLLSGSTAGEGERAFGAICSHHTQRTVTGADASLTHRALASNGAILPTRRRIFRIDFPDSIALSNSS